MAEMTSRLRVQKILSGEFPDRIPQSDTYWETTVARWRTEGLPHSATAHKYFHTDEIVFLSGDYSMQFPVRTVSKDDRIHVYWDEYGTLRRDLRTSEGWTSQWLDFTIKTPGDWTRHRGRMAFNDSRILDSALSAYEVARKSGKFVCYSAHAGFHGTWMKIGMENEMMLMLTDPTFVHELHAAHTELIIDIFEGFLDRGVEFDGIRLADDLGYRTSSLISPRLYREVVFPYHRKLCTYFANRGLPTLLHSDGNVSDLVPFFIEAGFRGLHPLEVKAGLDIGELRARYGDKLVLFGNIDVRALAGTPEELENELTRKFAVARESAAYIYHSDHSVPNNVSFDNYRLAMELVSRLGSFG
jgi:uroporphyrinogen decarboxylase